VEPTDWVAVYAAGLSTIPAVLNWRRTRTRVAVELEYDEDSSYVRVLNRSEHPIYVKAVAVDL
jgi:hypothetical protein